MRNSLLQLFFLKWIRLLGNSAQFHCLVVYGWSKTSKRNWLQISKQLITGMILMIISVKKLNFSM